MWTVFNNQKLFQQLRFIISYIVFSVTLYQRSDEFFNKIEKFNAGKDSSKDNKVIVEKCDKCGRTIHEKDDMKRHINDLHCQQCENKFSGDAHLKDHIEVDQEKDINDESILKPFTYNCEMCENVFDDSSDLQRHTENKHLSSYECLQFEYISMCKEDLDDHIMMNHVEKSLKYTFFNPSLYNVDGCSREGEVREV